MKQNYIRVEGSKSLMRDPYSGAIVNVDDDGYKNYIALKQANDRKRQEQQELQTEIDNIKSDVNEIKSLLLELLQRNK